MSAISSDPEMQKMIIRNTFYATSFILSAVGILSLTALVKYVFFSKSDNASQTISEKSKTDEQILLLANALKEMHQDSLNKFLKDREIIESNAKNLYQKEIEIYKNELSLFQKQYLEFKGSIECSLENIKKSNKESLESNNKLNEKEKDILCKIFDEKDAKYKEISNIYQEEIEKKILLIEKNHLKLIEEIKNGNAEVAKEKEEVYEKEIKAFKEESDFLKKKYEEFIDLIDIQNKKMLVEFTKKLEEYKAEQEKHATEVKESNKNLIEEISQNNAATIKEFKEKNIAIEKTMNQVVQEFHKKVEKLWKEYQEKLEREVAGIKKENKETIISIEEKCDSFQEETKERIAKFEQKYNEKSEKNLENMTNQVSVLAGKFEIFKEESQKIINRFNQANQDNIETLRKEFEEKLNKLSEEQKENLKLQGALLKVQQEQNEREKQVHEWARKDRQAKEAAEEKKKEFLEKNRTSIGTMIEK